MPFQTLSNGRRTLSDECLACGRALTAVTWATPRSMSRFPALSSAPKSFGPMVAFKPEHGAKLLVNTWRSRRRRSQVEKRFHLDRERAGKAFAPP